MPLCLRCNQPCVRTSKFCENCQLQLDNQLRLRAFQASPLLSPKEYSTILASARAAGDFDLRHTSLWEGERAAIENITGDSEQEKDLDSTIVVSVTTKGMVLGVYNGQITLSAVDKGGSEVQNSPQVVPVTLNVVL